MQNVKQRNMKGENGGIYGSAGVYNGDFDTIFAHDAVVVSLVAPKLQGVLANVAIPAGVYYFGRFSQVTVVSGNATIYNSA